MISVFYFRPRENGKNAAFLSLRLVLT